MPPPGKKDEKVLTPLESALKKLDDHLVWMAQPGDAKELMSLTSYLFRIRTAKTPAAAISVLADTEFIRELELFISKREEMDFKKFRTKYLDPIQGILVKLNSSGP